MTWAVATAKARFSALLDDAETKGPQRVTRRRKEFLVVTEEQWAQHSASDSPASVSVPLFLSVVDEWRLRPDYINDDLLFGRKADATLSAPDPSAPSLSGWDALALPEDERVDWELPERDRRPPRELF